jgi:hypothetical protein
MHGYAIAQHIERARYDSITPTGRKQLLAETRDFDQVVAAESRVMKPA